MLGIALSRLRSGEIDFEEFAREASLPVRRLARMIARRWPLPTHVDVEDVAQDLLAAISSFVWTFDPARGKTIEQYVVFNSVDKAKKRLHRARNAKRRDDRAPSRVECPLSSLSREGEEDEAGMLERVFARGGAVTDPDQDDLLERSDALDRVLASCRTEREAFVMAVLAEEGDVDAAARRIVADLESQRACRVRSIARAAELVLGTAISVAERLADEESAA